MKIAVIDSAAGTFDELALEIAKEALGRGLVTVDWGEALIVREERYPTALPTAPAVALPHAHPRFVRENGAILARVNPPVAMRLMGSGESVRVGLVIALALTDSRGHLEAISHLVGSLAHGAGARLEAAPPLAAAALEEIMTPDAPA